MEAVGFAIVALVLTEPWALADLGLADEGSGGDYDNAADVALDSALTSDVTQIDTQASDDTADTTAPDTTPADTGHADGSPCDDGRVCTQGDRWQGGICTSGENVCECEPNQKGCGSNGDAVNLCKGR